jgi:hypothetical protein
MLTTLFCSKGGSRSPLIFHFWDIRWLSLSSAASKRATNTHVWVLDGSQRQHARRWSSHTGCEGPTLLTIKTTVNRTTPRLFRTTPHPTTHRNQTNPSQPNTTNNVSPNPRQTTLHTAMSALRCHLNSRQRASVRRGNRRPCY